MRREVDEEFARYVRARQHRLLRAAYLVCGDAHLAEDVLQGALVKLAARWDKLRHDNPDAYVRRILYRDAVSAWRKTRHESLSLQPDLPVDPAAADRPADTGDRVDLQGALAGLTAKQRAVVVLRFFEDRTEADAAEVLGVSVGTVKSQTHAALSKLRVLLPGSDFAAHLSGKGPAMTERDLSGRLERASDDLPEVDLARRAWAAALTATRQRRRRWTMGVAGVAAAGVAVAAVQLGSGPSRPPAPGVSPTTSGAVSTLSDGTAYAQMPLEGKEGELRHFDSGLPSVIDPHAPAKPLSTLTRPLESVVAVYLRPDGQRFHPVLVTAGGDQLVADDVTLVATRDPGGNTGIPLGPSAVGGAGSIVFPQPGKVVLLDVHGGSVRSWAVPSQNLEQAGWAAGGGTIVARAEGKAWTIDPWKPGAKAQRADAAYQGMFRLDVDQQTPGRSIVVSRRDGRGMLSRGGLVSAPVYELWGDTVNTEQLAATGAFFDQDVTSKVIRRGNGPIYQGLVAVDTGTSKARVLLAPENPDGQVGRFKGCCAVLGWADGKTVLFQSVGSHGSWVLAWNVVTGEVFETSRIVVRPAQEQIPRLALNVGWRL